MTFFSNIFSGAKDFLGFDGSVGYQGTYATPDLNPSADSGNIFQVPVPSTKPDVGDFTNVTLSSGGTDFFSRAGDFISNAAPVLESGVNLFFGAKSKIEQLSAAQKLEKTKLDAITQASKNANTAAQLVLPTYQDFVDDPAAAARAVIPAALSGSGLQSGLGTATLAIAGLGLFLVMRK